MEAKIIIVVISAALVIQLCTGATIMNRKGTNFQTIVIRRSNQPGMYWALLGWQCLIVVACFLHVRYSAH
jgi:hypothetical protein